MAGLIYEFIDELKQETVLYNKLNKLANKKRSHIIKGEIDKINEINISEEKTVLELKRLERLRKQLMSDIAMILNINSKEITITMIEEALKNQPEEARELNTIKAALSKQLQELRVVNNDNMSLVNQSLEFVQFSMNALQSAMGGLPLTSNYGKTENERGKSFFDAKQ